VLDVNAPGLNFKHVRLQTGKDTFVDSLHVCPNSWTTSGFQSTDLLSLAGFKRGNCAFFQSECFVKEIPESFDVPGFAQASVSALDHLQQGETHLKNCGLSVPQPEGWGFYRGESGIDRRTLRASIPGNGHVAPKVNRLKETEDEYFQFVLTWMDGDSTKGWTTHYRAKHMPLSPEFAAALEFLGGFSTYNECPEFDFEICLWRFAVFQEDRSDLFGRHTENVHRCFDAHTSHFSSGLKSLLAAHVELQKYGFSFLKLDALSPALTSRSTPAIQSGVMVSTRKGEPPDLSEFDVAISFAGTEREYAKQLAEAIQSAGFNVFYDGFYPEQLWGKDLVAFFDRIYRKASKYCVMFISAEYSNRIWTSHERRSAQARALEEKGREYILPIRIDDTDLDGLPPTVGYLPLGQFKIEEIAELLIKKLKGLDSDN